MDAESADWYREAAGAVLRPMAEAESDFNAAYRGGRQTAIAKACQHLGRTARQAEAWSASNPCPSSDAELHLSGRVGACLRIVDCLSATPIRAELAERRDFRVADLQHKILWHSDAIATWAMKSDE